MKRETGKQKVDVSGESEKSLAEISAPIEWARSLDRDDYEKLTALLNLKSQELVKFLLNKGMDQTKLAELLDISQGHVSNILKGKRKTLEQLTVTLRNQAILKEKSAK